VSFITSAKKLVKSSHLVLNKFPNTSKEIKKEVTNNLEQLLAIIEAQEDRISTLMSESTESLNTSAIAKRLEAIENVNNKLCKEFIDFKSTIGQKSYSNAVKSGQQRQIDSKISEKSNHSVIIKPNNSQNTSS
jgi:septum formation inhibitor MinC